VIPSLAHFIWLGRRLPWLNALSPKTCALHGGFDRILVHHSDEIDPADLQELRGVPRLELERLAPEGLLESTAGPKAVDLYRALERPAAKANVLRIGLLSSRGGVYLDMDTLTIASLAPLRTEGGVFFGVEHLAYPGSVYRSRSPGPWLGAFARAAVRDVLRRMPEGYRAFRAIAKLYPSAANNAVIGAAPGHPFLETMTHRMLAMTPAERRVRYALGTSLLQAVAAESWGADVVVHPPAVFYPLGPVISEHWFRERASAKLEDVLEERTRVVHWYASVRTERHVERMDRAWIERHADHQLISALVKRYDQSPVRTSTR
jgi:Glycosyltransferase sugar-binding region containing DXD motif